jgi:hypothetical protein
MLVFPAFRAVRPDKSLDTPSAINPDVPEVKAVLVSNNFLRPLGRQALHQKGRKRKRRKEMNSKRTNRISKLTMGSLIGVFLMSGVLASTAIAKPKVVVRTRPVVVIHTNPRPYWNRGYHPFWTPSVSYRVVDPFTVHNGEGFNDGRDQGEKDAKKGSEFDPRGSKDYRKSQSFSYREAFVSGYRHGYRSELD